MDGGPRELPIKAGQAHYANGGPATSDKTYILDSAATHHMTADKNLLTSSYIDKDDPWFPEDIVKRVEVANGQFTPVCGVGNMETDTINLQDVLHIEELNVNLVSPNQLTNQMTTHLQERLWNNELTRHRQNEAMCEMEPEKQDAMHEVARQFHDLGVPLLVVDELTRQIGDLHVPPTQVLGFARRLHMHDDRASQQRVRDLELDLQEMRVPRLLIKELSRQLRTKAGSRHRINMLARPRWFLRDPRQDRSGPRRSQE